MKLKQFIGEDWFEKLQPFLSSNYFAIIQEKLSDILSTSGTTLVPSIDNVFNPFYYCRYADLKVVILNDEPFEELKANDGLAFSSSNPNVDVHKEAEAFMEGIECDIFDGFKLNKQHDLRYLAEQGVLLLNASLTCTHRDGIWYCKDDLWERFTNYVITTIAKDTKGIVFILCGKNVRKYADIILPTSNYLLTCTHPRDAVHFAQTWDSGGVFDITNKILKQTQNTEILW